MEDQPQLFEEIRNSYLADLKSLLVDSRIFIQQSNKALNFALEQNFEEIFQQFRDLAKVAHKI